MNKSESKYYNTAILMDEALLALLKKKNFEFITVKEICRKAGVNRSTFYLHYENIGELFAEATELINRRFHEGYKKEQLEILLTTKSDAYLITPEYLLPYLNFVKENKEIFKLVHEKPQLFNNRRAFERMYSEIFTHILDKFGVEEEKKPYVFTFFTQGVLAIVMKWVEDDCREEVDFVMNLIRDMVGHAP